MAPSCPGHDEWPLVLHGGPRDGSVVNYPELPAVLVLADHVEPCGLRYHHYQRRCRGLDYDYRESA